jgi:hypothetical protein
MRRSCQSGGLTRRRDGLRVSAFASGGRPIARAAWLGLILICIGCSGQAAAPQIPASDAGVDATRVLSDLRFLSSPELGGRATGSPGNTTARNYIEREFERAGLRMFGSSFRQPFTAEGREAANVVGYLPGSRSPGRFIVVTAHFDHLGTRDGVVFPGADDNASGTAGLLEIARQVALSPTPPDYSIVFAALDAEEIGLRGARAFVANPPVPRDSIILNVNLDMVSRNDTDEMYIAGTYHYPSLVPLVESVAARSELRVLRGHDRPGVAGEDDWTELSDHAAFHETGIPFLYFGVEDHADYHRPTDTFERIDPAFFVSAVETVLDLVRSADRLNW